MVKFYSHWNMKENWPLRVKLYKMLHHLQVFALTCVIFWVGVNLYFMFILMSKTSTANFCKWAEIYRL